MKTINNQLGKFICFILLFTSVSSYAQVPIWGWAAGGSADNTYGSIAYGVANYGVGNIYVVGSYSSWIHFGNLQQMTNPGMYIVKYDGSGNALWSADAGATSVAKGVATDNTGNVLVAGYYGGSTISFGSTTLSNAGSNDIFLVKYNSSGNVLWAKRAGGNSSDYGYSVSCDNFGNIIVVGVFQSSTITFGSTTLVNSGNFDIFIVKYDPNGNVLWANNAGGNYPDNAWSVANDAAGNVYVTGFFRSSTMSFGSTTIVNADPSGGSEDIFIAKYDQSGNLLWAKREGGADSDRGQGLAVDANGNIVVTGYFISPVITFGSTTLNNASNNSGYEDTYVVKYDTNGNPVWAKSAFGSNNDDGRSVSIDPSGHIYLVGNFKCPSINFGNSSLTNANSTSPSYDIFLVKYDANGNVLWANSQSSLGTGIDNAFSIATDANGNVYVAGYFWSTAIEFGPTHLSGNGLQTYSYMFVAQLNTLTDIDDNEPLNEVNVFPNPSSERVTIEVLRPQENTTVEIEIYDAFGKMIYSNSMSTLGTASIDISDKPSGIYFLMIKMESHTIEQKLVIQKQE